MQIYIVHVRQAKRYNYAYIQTLHLQESRESHNLLCHMEISAHNHVCQSLLHTGSDLTFEFTTPGLNMTRANIFHGDSWCECLTWFSWTFSILKCILWKQDIRTWCQSQGATTGGARAEAMGPYVEMEIRFFCNSIIWTFVKRCCRVAFSEL